MTISKVLAQAKKGKEEITVYESADKPHFVPYYEIVVVRDGIAINVIKTAKTTWKKKFKEMTR